MEDGRVHPGCVNAGNPYHECAGDCFDKISQGQGRKHKKKSGLILDNRNGIKEGVFSKKMDGERRANPTCPKASNPFHNCDIYCSNRSPGANPQWAKNESGSTFPSSSSSFGRKNMGSESQPKSTQLANNVSAVKAVRPADTPSPSSPYPARKMKDSDNSQSFSSSQQHSDGNYSLYHSSDKEQHQSSELMTTSRNLSPDRHKVPSNGSLTGLGIFPPNKQKGNERLHTSPADSGPISKNAEEITAGPTVDNFTLSFKSRASEESDEEDVRSVISDSCVSVGKYHVRSNVASTLQLIFDKYGDIAANCLLQSVSMRASYLECLCFVVQELQSTPFNQLTKSKIKEMLAILKDIESVRIDVSWLCSTLDELREAMEVNSQNKGKENYDELIKSTRKELDTMMEDLAQKEKAVADAKSLVAETTARLSDLELESSQLSESILSIGSKIEKFNGKSLIDGIL